MASTIVWPLEVLPPREIMAEIAPRSLAGPSSISGVTQVVATDAGIWKVSFVGVPVVDQQKVLAWRGINSILEGRMTPVIVPLSRWYQPVPDGQDHLYGPVPHSDSSPFSDGSKYQGQVIDVTLASNVPVRGTTATIDINNAGLIQPGQRFSIGERLYQVKTISYSSDEQATITFRPPAREAASIGDRLNFDFPVCKMRLVSDSSMDMGLDYGRWSFPTVSFIEDV
ncbi:hypothetical protein [Nitratireductor basaltis]|uniref:Uncharacterized protein n=1 Tax=Nitratireductor basaltis TaxID=472175 RepID=A0A084UBJ3_9HYPH|nr:hypothetical protein [Nitratireductor basaltis]KFB10329.1 hypothetical protein EL18_01360 [Nitratireductor basaltis]